MTAAEYLRKRIPQSFSYRTAVLYVAMIFWRYIICLAVGHDWVPSNVIPPIHFGAHFLPSLFLCSIHNNAMPKAQPATFNQASGKEQCLPGIPALRISSAKAKSTQGKSGHKNENLAKGKVAVQAQPINRLSTKKQKICAAMRKPLFRAWIDVPGRRIMLATKLAIDLLSSPVSSPVCDERSKHTANHANASIHNIHANKKCLGFFQPNTFKTPTPPAEYRIIV